MNLLIATAGVVLVAACVCGYGLVLGRRGATKTHHRAFVAGLAGILSVPLWLLGLAGLFSQLFWARLASASGMLFMVASAVLMVAVAYVIQAHLKLRTRLFHD